jgi:hypothetical protein
MFGIGEKDHDIQTVSSNKAKVALEALKKISESLEGVISLLESDVQGGELGDSLHLVTDTLQSINSQVASSAGQQIVEGVFDGQKMIDQDGVIHEVPANYASKSKLIEGDILKLTITKTGDRIFKQIAPVERKRVVGTLAIDDVSGQYYVMADGKAYRVIPASVTYYRGEIGDEVVLLVPKDGTSAWAAIENIVKR